MKSVLILLTVAAGSFAAVSMQPGNLRCEYRANPQGIDVTAPRLSWMITGGDPKARGLRQTAYRVLAASTEAGLKSNTSNLWDTGKVSSDQSIQVVYAGKQLGSGAVAFWKVQIWDQDGKASEWSAPAQWSMGLLHADDWQAKWIGRDEPGIYQDPASRYQVLRSARWIWDAPNAQTTAPAGDRYFRQTVTVPADRKIARAVLIAAGDNNAEAFLNGESVSKSNPTLPPVVDVTALLHPGDNSIAIQVTHPRPDRPAGVIALLRIEFESGALLMVATDNRWRTASKVEEGWQKPEYVDIAWPPAQELGEYGMAPWGPTGIAAEHRLPGRILRKEFTADRKVRRAVIYMAGLGSSELYLNGSKVGDHVLSPGLTDYDKRVLYVTYDVTKQLAAGANTIGVMLGNGRYYAPRLQSGTRNFGYPKALVQLNLEYEDGTRGTVASDDTWKLTTAGPVRANNEYDGEEYDARMEMNGWSRAGFDASAWEAAQIVAAPGGVLASEMAEPLRVTDTLKPRSVKLLKPGTYIFDMGQNMVGWCRLHVTGPKGTTVQLRHAETLNPDGSLYLANLRTAQATDLYTLKGEGEEVWEPRFTYHGFRFVEVTGFPGEPKIGALEGRVVHDDMEKTADFTSSNALLNQIHHNVLWGIAGNYRSIPTDCPQRDERQGWLGDRSQVSRSESYMFDVAAFYSKWAGDLADSQRADGSVPDVSPNYWPLYNDDLTWPSTFIFVPGMLYEEYGDKRAIEQYYPAMRKWLDHVKGFVQPDGLVSKDQYADWCVPPEDPKLIHSQDPARVTDKTLIASSYYYELLRVIARYARILDKPTEAADLEMAASKVNSAFQLRFFKPAENIYGNGTQTSSVLPLFFDMVPRESRAGVLASLARNIEDITHGHVGTGLVGAQWLMRTLSDNGRSDLAYTVATQKTYPGWGYMVEQGATTIWELWNGNTADPAMNSGNHVMQIGDLAVWMYEYLAGIRSDPEKPGFHHILIRPYPAGDLTSVAASHKSMYGAIATSWKRDGTGFALNVTVPPNTSATVWLPAKEGDKLTESNKPAANATGVKFLRWENGNAVFEVESGKYAFAAR